MTEHVVLGDRYELDSVIGRGGMAEVWSARDQRLGRQVAVKRLRIDLATDPTFHARFRREAQSAAGLNHPGIVSTYDTGESQDAATGIMVPFIVMELVEGHTLRDVLREGRKILPERALEWTQGVLEALGYSHRQGIVHRDIKPANVMLTPTGRVKVMDFGIARAVADTSATMTQTAAVIGTAQYLSPEQARGEQVDARSDIYSTGCLLYELLIGRPPFVGDSPVSVAYQHVRETPVPPSHLDPVITEPMDAITMKALAKDPAARYQSAEEMRDDIGRLLAGQPVAAVVPPPLAGASSAVTEGGLSLFTEEQPAASPPRRRSGVAWTMGVLLLAIVVAVVYGAYLMLKPTTPTQAMTTVPGVQTFTLVQAEQLLADHSLKTGVVTHQRGANDDTVGTVIKQDPTQGTSVAVGSAVNLTVNDGPTLVTLPGVTGATTAKAEAALKKAGFTNVTTVTNDPVANPEPTTAAAGTVVSVSPAAGFQGVATTQVTLTVATGKSVVPNLRGKTRDDARQGAKAAGFTHVVVQISTTVVATTSPPQVINQIPTDGTLLDRTATLTLVMPATAPPTQSPSASASASAGASASSTP